MAHVAKEAKRSHDLPDGKLGNRNARGVTQPKSKFLRIKRLIVQLPA